MKKPLLAAALCAAMSAGVAAAPATYVFNVNGSGTQTDVPHALDWTGTLTIVTDSAADGLYAFGSLVSFDFESSLGSFVTDGAVDPFLQVGEEVTVANGRVTGIEGGYSPDHYARFFFDGLSARLTVSDCDACNLLSASAVLTPVPEPGPYVLMLSGLAVVGWARRRRFS